VSTSATELRKRSNGDARPYYDAAKNLWKVAVELEAKDGTGRQRKIVAAKTAVEARALARKTREQLAAGVPVARENHTVASYLKWWETVVLPGTVSEGSEVTYKGNIRLYIIPSLGKVRLVKLTPGHVTAMMRTMEAQGLSPATRNGAKKVLGRALRRAMQEELLHRNVAYIADGARLNRTERRSFTPAQAKTVLAAFKDDRLAAGYEMTLALGLRLGEVTGLSWDDIDLDATPPVLTVRRQLQRRARKGLVLCDLKTPKSRRTLAIPDHLVATLRHHSSAQAAEHLAAGPHWEDSGLVLTTPYGRPIDPGNFRHDFAKITIAAGLGAWTIHELRHSAGSLLFAMGVPMKVISETLGHSSERVTSEIYVHLQAEHRIVASDAMTRALWG
jgi:integrase